MPGEVFDNTAESRFELAAGGATAIAEYRIEAGRVVLTHTKVPQQLSGQGIGSRLAQGVFEAIRDSGRKVALECPFMAAYARRHPEYADLAEG